MKKFFNSIMPLVMLLAVLGIATTSAVYWGSKTPFFEYTKVVGGENGCVRSNPTGLRLDLVDISRNISNNIPHSAA